MDSSNQRKWNGQSRGGRFGNAFFVFLIRFLGIRAAYIFLAFVAVYFIPFAPKATRSIWKYYRKRLNKSVLSSIVNLYLHFYTFGQTLIDKVAMRSGLQSGYSFEFDNYDRFLEIINGEEGVVLVGAHVGCWEAGSGFFGKYGKKINIVKLDLELQDVKDAIGTEGGDYKIIPLNEGLIDAMLKINVALNNGEYVCFNGDRYLDYDSTIAHDFLGSEAHFPLGIFKIAVKCRKPVVFYFAMREKGRKYRFAFTEITERLSEKELVAKYAETLESIVRKYPRQWFNFYDYWND